MKTPPRKNPKAEVLKDKSVHEWNGKANNVILGDLIRKTLDTMGRVKREFKEEKNNE